MANGYLYVICGDCERHPEEVIRRNSHFTLFRDYENTNGHAGWTKEAVERWLRHHVEGNCTGAAHASQYSGVIDASRLRLTESLPDPTIKPEARLTP